MLSALRLPDLPIAVESLSVCLFTRFLLPICLPVADLCLLTTLCLPIQHLNKLLKPFYARGQSVHLGTAKRPRYRTIWPTMDPAQTDDRISRLESALQHVIAATAQGRHDLTQICQELANVETGATAPPPDPAATETPASLPREPSVGVPERYDGDPTTCNAFLCKCSINFSLQPLTFASEEARVAYTINHHFRTGASLGHR